LLTLEPDAIRDLRGARLAMIFQEPMTSLNPAYTVGDQIIEAILLHSHRWQKARLSRREARDITVGLFRDVGISMPDQRVDAYPWQLSGGLRQRAMIAMALSCKPRLLIADEPTTAIDVTTQAQILNLLRDLQRVFGDINGDADRHRAADFDSVGCAGDDVDFSSYGGYVQRCDACGVERFLKRQPLRHGGRTGHLERDCDHHCRN